MTGNSQSPAITKLSWGGLTLADGRVFRDAMLFPGGAREWDWNETDTSHDPGIKPAAVAELVAQGATAVILSSGFQERLAVTQETIDWLTERNVTVQVLPTEVAVSVYNQLREKQPVAGLFHTTC